MTDLKLSAFLASVVIISGFAVYWWLQIESVRELLAMAYG